MNSEKIPFDPGFAPVVANDIGQVGCIHYMFSELKDIKLKRAKFPLVFAKIEKTLKINVAFYLGCLLWASCIKQFLNGEIKGNMLLGEVVEEKEYTSEINFLIDFVQYQLPKDYKYYKNQIYNSDIRFLPILKTYKEFLILNKGFVNCEKTNQIALPDNLKALKDDSVSEKIQNAIKEKNLELLFECYDLIF